MASKTEIKERLEFRRTSLKVAREAYVALLSGQVQSYAIGSRNLTRLDLEKLKAEIDSLEKEIDELTAALNGGYRRRAVGIVPRDW
jgi:DNA gyrase/topoisomerase IV subunit A